MNAHPSHASAPHPYFAYIDGLRAIAVLGVIAYHLDSGWLPGGFAGVDVFFVISGFVVSASVARWNGSGLGGFLAYFYARRIRRIVPALVFCLLSTSLACTLFIPFAWLSSAIETTGRYAFFGLSNLYLASHNESYFSPTAEFNPYTHTWS
ncbi:MAG: acyltransferase, partial [Dokdonella sp.]|nr:acyltransferase [Dokdonella sp.]